MTLLLAGFVAVPYIYFCWKLLTALACLGLNSKVPLRWVVIGGACAVNLYPLMLLLGYGFGVEMVARPIREANGVFDTLFTYPFWAGGIVVLQMVMPFIVLDLLKLPLWLFDRGHTALWRGIEARIILGMVTLMVVYVVGRIYSDTCRVQINERVWSIAGLPEGLDGLRIVHISDLQADLRTDETRMGVYIEKVNALKPDLVIFTGDLVTSGTEHIEAGAGMLGKIRSRYGIYACIGDHDYWASREQVVRSLQRRGIVVLEDESRAVPVDSAMVAIAGVMNIYSQRPGPEILERIEAMRFSSTDTMLSIFITHQPSGWLVDFAREKGYALFLAGHTHGGQVVLRWPGITLTPVMRETPYLSGFYEAGTMLISVNNGLGLTLAPLRYQAPAEVTLIEVRRATRG
jgi:predicted MPP superfamily phosphohydrolase